MKAPDDLLAMPRMWLGNLTHLFGGYGSIQLRVEDAARQQEFAIKWRCDHAD